MDRNHRANAKTQQRCKGMRAYDEHVCILNGIYSMHFEKAFGMAGKLETAEKLLLCGPYGKCLLEGCFHARVQKVIF